MNKTILTEYNMYIDSGTYNTNIGWSQNIYCFLTVVSTVSLSHMLVDTFNNTPIIPSLR